MSAEKKLTTKIFRVLAAWFIDVITALFGEERTKYLTALGQSAWAANNSVDVGMVENAEVLNPLLAQPGNEQIYTTQPAWTFVEDDESVAEGNRTRYQLGSYVEICTDGTYDTVGTVKDHDSDTVREGYTLFPIPSLIYDTDGNPHVVFPVWQASGSFETKYVNAAGQVSDTAQTGFIEKKIFVGSYGFAPMTLEFKKNLNVYGGGLDGFQWQEVSLISESSVTVTGDAQTGFTASVPTTATVAVGTWVRLTYTESDASKTAYGYVSAVGEDEVTVTVVGACGTTVTKVELYKPVGQ